MDSINVSTPYLLLLTPVFIERLRGVRSVMVVTRPTVSFPRSFYRKDPLNVSPCLMEILKVFLYYLIIRVLLRDLRELRLWEGQKWPRTNTEV